MGVLGREEILKRIIVGELILFGKLKHDIHSARGKTVELNEADSAIKDIDDIMEEYGRLYENIVIGTQWKQIKEEQYPLIQEKIMRFVVDYASILKKVAPSILEEITEEDTISLWLSYRTAFIKWVHSGADSKGISFLDELIKSYVKPYISVKAHEIKYPILINDFNLDQLSFANYDLRVGKEGYVTSDKYPKKLDRPHMMLFDTYNPFLVIPPGSFGIVVTHEYLFIPPDIYGLISLRFSIKIKGLVNVSGFHIDPGYCGNIIFGVYNAGSEDIILKYSNETFMIAFLEISHTNKNLLGVYSKKSYDSIPTGFVEQLSGDPVSLRDLDRRLGQLEKITYMVLVGLGISLLLFVLQYLSHGGG